MKIFSLLIFFIVSNVMAQVQSPIAHLKKYQITDKEKIKNISNKIAKDIGEGKFCHYAKGLHNYTVAPVNALYALVGMKGLPSINVYKVSGNNPSVIYSQSRKKMVSRQVSEGFYALEEDENSEIQTIEVYQYQYDNDTYEVHTVIWKAYELDDDSTFSVVGECRLNL